MVLFTAGATCALAGVAPLALAQFKTNKTSAKYQEKPNGEARCAYCKHFEPPRACGRVEGAISPNGWCRFFARKA